MPTTLAAVVAVVASAAAATPLPEQVDVSRQAGAQYEPTVAVDPLNKNALLAAATTAKPRCAVSAFRSSNGGRTWVSQTIKTPSFGNAALRSRRAPCAGNAWTAIDSTGTQYVAFVVSDPTAPLVSGVIPYVLGVASRAERSESWRTSEPSLPLTWSGTDDKPVVIADTSPGSPHSGRIYVAWSRHDTFRSGDSGQILEASSDNHGQTWSSPRQIGSKFGWGVHLAIGTGGLLYAAWWDPSGSLIGARSDDGGRSFTPQRQIVSLLVPGAGVGYIRAESRTVMPDPALAASTSTSRLYLAYSRPTLRGRRIEVLTLDGSLKALRTRILAARRTGTYDEFNPSVAVDPTSRHIWSCFYVTGVRAKAKYASYSCARSTNGGEHWTTARSVVNAPSNETQPGSYSTPAGIEGQYGAYAGLAVSGGVAHPIWTDSRRFKVAREEIYTTTIRG